MYYIKMWAYVTNATFKTCTELLVKCLQIFVHRVFFTRRWHGNEVVVKALRFSITSVIGGNYSQPVCGHCFQAKHCVRSQSNWSAITAGPFKVFYWSDLHKVPQSFVLYSFYFCRFSPSQRKSCVVGRC